MILRETATRAQNSSISAVQNPRSKCVDTMPDAAQCFQRLANFKMAETKEETETDAANLHVDFSAELEPPIDIAASVSAVFSTTVIAHIAAQNLAGKSMFVTTEPIQVEGQNPDGNAEIFHDLVHQKKGCRVSKPDGQVHILQDAKAEKPKPALDLKPEPVTGAKPADIGLVIVNTLAVEAFTQAMNAAPRISDLPHITRVQIEQTKRNSAGTLTSLELVLEPAELGRITAKIQHMEGRVTLVLSAEHRAIADDLARDSGLLLKVLGDQIPGISKMAVFVQTEAQQEQILQCQGFAEFSSDSRQQNQYSHAHESFHTVQPNAEKDMPLASPVAIGLHVRI